MCDVTKGTQSGAKSQNLQVTKSTGLKFCKIDVLQQLHISIVVMVSP